MNNDLISRSALISAIEKGEGISWERYGDNEVCIRKKYIDNAPTIKIFTLEDIEEQYRKGLEKGLSEWETERPQGEWIEIERQGRTGDGRVFTFTIIVCSNCGEQFDIEGEKFCPHCGADMRGKG